jgi:PTS system beta-glucosides-specific IIC component
MDYKKVAGEILSALGGWQNIKSLNHCATRLRISLADQSKLNISKLESNKNILGVINNNTEIQLIIGTEVQHVYNEIMKISKEPIDTSITNSDSSTKQKANNGGLLDRFLAIITAIFTPYIPVLATSGIVLGLIAIATNSGWLSEKSPTYITFAAMGKALIYFFPILLAFTAANRFGANPFIGATIGAALLYPDLNKILVSGAKLDFLGISYTAMNFANTVIPILISMWVLSHLEKFLKKSLPKILQFMLVPLISILVMVPLTLIVFGPIGNLLASGIGRAYEFLLKGNIIIFSLLFGAFFIFVIMFGLHWIVLPLQLQILADKGLEYSLAAGGMGNYALLGVTLAVLLFHQDKELKGIAGSAAFVNLISGITEPGLYGVCVRNKHYFLSVILGGAAGGLICGLFKVYVKAFAFTGIIGLPAFAAATEVFPYYLISVLASIGVAFSTTIILMKKSRKGHDFEKKSALNQSAEIMGNK